MKLKTLATLSLAAGSIFGCTTTKDDVADTERKGEENTTKAYEKADETALKSQDQADQTAEKTADQAAAKIDKADDKAAADTAKAYSDAEHVQTKAERDVAIVTKKEYVDSMSKKLAEHHSGIRHMEKSLKKQPASDKVVKGPKLDIVKADEREAKDELKKLKNGTVEDFSTMRSKVDEAFAKLEKDFQETKASW